MNGIRTAALAAALATAAATVAACRTASGGAPSSEATLGNMSAQEVGYGTADEVAFAKQLWTGIQGYEDWKMTSDIYPGQSPHGAFLRMAGSFVTVEGRSYPVIVKDNFAGDEADVREMPSDHLAAITVMLQRRPGYDPAHGDWFYVKYSAQGEVVDGPDGVPMAGRISGCVRCHDDAMGDDYLFHND